MTREELKTKVEFVTDEQVKKIVYVFVTTDTTGLQLFNIVDRDLQDLTGMFTQSVKTMFIDKEYTIENYSTSLRRDDVLHIYDLDDKHTPEMTRMAEVAWIQDPEYFDKSTTKIEKVNGIYIIIKDEDNQHVITLFKNISNVDKAYAASSFLIFGKENKLFERQKENMLRISPNFHMMRVDDKIILTDLDKLETPLHLDAILQKETERDVKTLSKGLIINDEKLIKVCQKPKLCKKLRHALKESKVVKKLADRSLDGKMIIDFVKNKTNLKFHFNRGGTKFELKSEAEAIRFIKLMDDDYLLSELTGEKYDSDVKDPMVVA